MNPLHDTVAAAENAIRSSGETMPSYRLDAEALAAQVGRADVAAAPQTALYLAGLLNSLSLPAAVETLLDYVAAETGPDTSLRLRCENLRGILALQNGDLRKAKEVLEAAQAIAGGAPIASEITVNLAAVLLARGESVRAGQLAVSVLAVEQRPRVRTLAATVAVASGDPAAFAALGRSMTQLLAESASVENASDLARVAEYTSLWFCRESRHGAWDRAELAVEVLETVSQRLGAIVGASDARALHARGLLADAEANIAAQTGEHRRLTIAISVLADVADRSTRILGPSHARTAFARAAHARAVAVAASQPGNTELLDQALALLAEAAESATTALGAEHPVRLELLEVQNIRTGRPGSVEAPTTYTARPNIVEPLMGYPVGLKGQHRRVLIAEDDALLRLDLAELLSEEGYEVVGEAGDGRTAVKLAEELRPDLCIFDIKMPIMDGLEAAEKVANGRIAPVVILTAFSQRDLVERSRMAGAMAYLVKPFQTSDLVPAIEIALSRFAELSALEAEVAGLTERLETRKAVERAKGALMTQYGMTEPQAFKWIQRTAMDHTMSMKEVSERVIGELTPPE